MLDEERLLVVGGPSEGRRVVIPRGMAHVELDETPLPAMTSLGPTEGTSVMVRSLYRRVRRSKPAWPEWAVLVPADWTDEQAGEAAERHGQ